MLLSLDTTISFHLYFKVFKFEKNSSKYGGSRTQGQRNKKGKRTKHPTFLLFGVRDKCGGEVVWTGAADAWTLKRCILLSR